MGKVVKVIKDIYRKIDWGIVKNILISLLNTKIKIKENNVELKIDKRFIREFTHQIIQQI